MMMPKLRAAVLALVLPAIAACSADHYSIAGLRMEIRDAVTGAPAAMNVTLEVRDGDYLETVNGAEIWMGARPEDALVLMAADDRPGRYDITITSAGYEPWVRTGVVVRRTDERNPFDGSATVEQVNLKVDLQPVSGT